MKTITLNCLAKYKEPENQLEKELILKVININNTTNRVIIEIQNMPGFNIKPTQLLSTNDIELL